MNHIKNVHIRSNAFKPSSNLKELVHKSTDRLYRHENEIERIEVFLSRFVHGNKIEEFKCTTRIAVPGPDIIVAESGTDIEKLVTRVSHKLDRQIRKRSRKQNSICKSSRLKDMQPAI